MHQCGSSVDTQTAASTDTSHFHYASTPGTLKEHNLGQYGYSHVWELHSVKAVPIDDITGEVTKITTTSPAHPKDSIYCEHTYRPRGRDHMYEPPHISQLQQPHVIADHSDIAEHDPLPHEHHEVTPMYHELDAEDKDNKSNQDNCDL